MLTNRTQLNPRNPLHWLLLIYWFVVFPARLRQYQIGLDQQGEKPLYKTRLGAIVFLTVFPQFVLFGYLIAQSQMLNHNFDWYVYLPTMMLTACVIIVSLIKNKVDIVWVAGFAAMLTTLTISVGFSISLVAEHLVFGSGGMFENDNELPNITYLAISLALCVIAIILSGMSAGLARIPKLNLSDTGRSEAGRNWPVGIRIGIALGLSYGFMIGVVANPRSNIDYGYDSDSIKLIVALSVMLGCLFVFRRGSSAVAVTIGVAIAVALGAFSLMSIMVIYAKGLGVFMVASLMIWPYIFVALLPILVILAVGYGLAFGFAFWMVRRIANSLVRRYQRVGDDKADEASTTV